MKQRQAPWQQLVGVRAKRPRSLLAQMAWAWAAPAPAPASERLRSSREILARVL